MAVACRGPTTPAATAPAAARVRAGCYPLKLVACVSFLRAGMNPLVLRDAEANARKVAANESAFRTANERLRRAAQSHRFREDDRVPFICECADERCHEIVMLTLSDYEHIRSHPTWFLLVAGHEEQDGGLERIVDAEQGYAVVEKLGIAGDEAARLHPRRIGGG